MKRLIGLAIFVFAFLFSGCSCNMACFDFDYTEQPMEVIYYKCGFKLRSKDCKETYDYSIHDETPELEVIGNIFDNNLEDL